MRNSRTAPLVDVEAEHYCEGILTAIPAELPCGRASRFGATAWRVSMARRQVVESANSALKGACADLSRGFFRVMGLWPASRLNLVRVNFPPTDRTSLFRMRNQFGIAC